MRHYDIRVILWTIAGLIAAGFIRWCYPIGGNSHKRSGSQTRFFVCYGYNKPHSVRKILPAAMLHYPHVSVIGNGVHMPHALLFRSAFHFQHKLKIHMKFTCAAIPHLFFAQDYTREYHITWAIVKIARFLITTKIRDMLIAKIICK